MHPSQFTCHTQQPLTAHMLPLLQEADMGSGAVEMRFSLPAAASPAMLMLLLAACRELQRAGSFACSSTAVHLMSWELGRAIVAVLRWGHTQLMSGHYALLLCSVS